MTALSNVDQGTRQQVLDALCEVGDPAKIERVFQNAGLNTRSVLAGLTGSDRGTTTMLVSFFFLSGLLVRLTELSQLLARPSEVARALMDTAHFPSTMSVDAFCASLDSENLSSIAWLLQAYRVPSAFPSPLGAFIPPLSTLPPPIGMHFNPLDQLTGMGFRQQDVAFALSQTDNNFLGALDTLLLQGHAMPSALPPAHTFFPPAPAPAAASSPATRTVSTLTPQQRSHLASAITNAWETLAASCDVQPAEVKASVAGPAGAGLYATVFVNMLAQRETSLAELKQRAVNANLQGLLAKLTFVP